MELKDVKVAKRRGLAQRFWEETWRHKTHFIVIVLAIMCAQTASVIVPLLMRQLINALASGGAQAGVVQGLFITISLMTVAMIARWIFWRIQMWNISTLESKAMANIGNSSFEYLIRHSHHFYASQFTGSLTRKVHKYMNAFETIFDAILMNFFATAYFVSGAVIILYLRNHVLGVALAVWAIVFVIAQIYLSRLHQPMRAQSAIADSQLGGAVADAFGNHATITLHTGVQYEKDRLAGFIRRWGDLQLKTWHFMEYIYGTQGILIIGINIALLFGAVIYWQRGELTVGDFILIQTYLIGAVEMLGNIASQLRRFYTAISDAEEMIDLLEMPHDIRDLPGAPALAVSRGDIQFNDVQFGFSDDNPILERFDISIAPGQKVALVGPSGAGKSTITKLLLRLYDVNEGVIEIDGQNIAQVTQESLREAIGFVPQEPILFHRTLMENIRYGRRDATDEEVIEAAKKAHCHEFITHLKYQYETYVGERGIKLSGGERQRVAIARAILKDAPILVLDEATSSLDSESESLIQDSLKVLMQGKTVLVIAHRLSTIMHMDRIVVIDSGGIVADGTHEALLAQGGFYQKLWSIQAGGFIQDDEE